MTRTDEARRLLQRAFQLDLPKPLTADILVWLAANPEGKPDAGVKGPQNGSSHEEIAAGQSAGMGPMVRTLAGGPAPSGVSNAGSEAASKAEEDLDEAIATAFETGDPISLWFAARAYATSCVNRALTVAPKPDAGVTEAINVMVTDIPRSAHPLVVGAAYTVVSQKESPGHFRLQPLASAVPAAPETIPAEWPWRHKKRGTLYRVIDRANIQTGNVLGDLDEVIVYQGQDGRMWVRPMDEFYDGRFEEVEPAAPAAPAVSQLPADTRETGNG